MTTTIPPVHNYESQIVFSNQSNNVKSTDVINWTIAPSGDDVYFNLYKSRMTFKLKISEEEHVGHREQHEGHVHLLEW